VDDLTFGRRYKTIEKIGSGGMADVYKAVDETLGRTVAVKVLHPRYASDPAFVARFRQEAQAAANLSHPNIVNIYDWGREGDTYYIVMEFVRGTDLKTLVTEHGPLDPRKAAEYAAQVCAALSVAHGYDIIHRDIKPHNIVLTPDGIVKVMDFGIARAGNTTMTQTGSVLGTAQYISPEQAQGRTLGPASDLYSLGVVLYELTTGVLPFDGDTPVAVALKQVNEEPRPPRRRRESIPPDLEAVILRAMRKDPAERYTSAEEMRDDLRRVLAGAPVATPALIDETSVLPAVGRTRDSARHPARSPRRGPQVLAWVLALAALLAIGLFAAWALGLFGPSTVAVPDLTGLTQQEASSTLTGVGLSLGTVKTTPDPEAAKGTIISQDPGVGARVPKKSSIDIVVSSGVESVDVPDLVGLPQEDALRALRETGLQLDTIAPEYSTSFAEGTVMRQTPEAAEKVAKGTAVTLVVSRGTQLVSVPDVTDLTTAEARASLAAAGFTASTSSAFSDTVTRGRVISQNPQGGVSVAAGARVTVTVSQGPDTVTVPDVRGMAEADARTTLQRANLRVLVNYQVSPDDGLVLTQNPIPNASARRGDTVTIWVGQAPPAQ